MRKRPLAEPDASQLRELGRVIRASRRGLLSLEGLADRANISLGLLSRIENGTGNPSVEVLLRIANALGLELTDLLEPPPGTQTHIVRAGHRRKYRSPAGPDELELITSTMHYEIAVTLCAEDPGDVRAAQQPVSGDVLFYVLAGEIVIEKNGDSYPLRTGDSLLVAFPYQIVAIGNEPAKHLLFFRPAEE